MLGLPGFVVLAVSEVRRRSRAGGGADVSGCPGRGVRARAARPPPELGAGSARGVDRPEWTALVAGQPASGRGHLLAGAGLTHQHWHHAAAQHIPGTWTLRNLRHSERPMSSLT